MDSEFYSSRDGSLGHVTSHVHMHMRYRECSKWHVRFVAAAKITLRPEAARSALQTLTLTCSEPRPNWGTLTPLSKAV